MKLLTIVTILCLVSGCSKHGRNTNVSDLPPHDKLTGTIWKLKTDAYIIEWGDHRRMYYIYPLEEKFVPLRRIPVSGQHYDEENIGKKGGGLKIVGGLRAGESLKIVKVLKNSHIEMGTTYIPMMIPLETNKWTGVKELNGATLYRRFNEKGILNPKYAEKLDKQIANQSIEPIETTPAESGNL